MKCLCGGMYVCLCKPASTNNSESFKNVQNIKNKERAEGRFVNNDKIRGTCLALSFMKGNN